MISIKSDNEIEILSKGGKILANVLESVLSYAKSGVSTKELDDLAEKLIIEAGGEPAFKGYGESCPYPATLCTSINDEIVHCIPGSRILQDGDILGIDIGMKWPKENGLFTDMAKTIAIGNVSQEIQNLLDVTKGALNKAISIIKPNIYLNEIGSAIEDYVKSRGNYGIVRDLVGHGVGYDVHEEPRIVNYKTNKRGEILKPGMVLAIEPMINLGSHEIKIKDNGWDIVTSDESLSAHFEHTIVVTENGCKILTQV